MEPLYVLKAHFSSKKWKNAFLQKPPESVRTKKWESSEKRAVFKERHKYATQNKWKKWKNRQKWRCYRPKYSLGGPGRPPQPEFASKIRSVASTFLVIRNQNWDLAFFRFFCFLFLSNFLFFWKNGAVFFVFLRISWWWLWWERKDRRQGGKHVNPYTPPNSRSPAPAALLNRNSTSKSESNKV